MERYLSREEIASWQAAYELPENIIRHMQAVSRVAVFLAQRLNKVGEEIDVELVEKGALLHDLDKLMTLEGDADHGTLGGQLLRERGQDVIAAIVERHVINAFDTHDPHLWTWEQRLVHYADKLCIGTRLVPLTDRLADLRCRYPRHAPAFDRYQPAEEALEQAILSRLGMTPAEVPRLLAEADV